jgi:hypothetical protein
MVVMGYTNSRFRTGVGPDSLIEGSLSSAMLIS